MVMGDGDWDSRESETTKKRDFFFGGDGEPVTREEESRLTPSRLISMPVSE